MSKFIILAIARSGSTSLARTLNESKEVKLAIEPFNPDYIKWNPNEPNYSERVNDLETLDEVADELFDRFTAIKTLDYQLDTEMYEHLMSRPKLKVILLYRKNVLESVLSAEISKQTGAWHKEDLDKSIEESYNNLKPVRLDLIREHVDYTESQHKKLVNFLQKNKRGNCIELYYEDLYSEDSDKNRQTITNICDFLDVSVPDKKSIEKYMKISNAKVNSLEQYRMIPNFDEISRAYPSQ
jgi:LPS sulfotransferase NodH